MTSSDSLQSCTLLVVHAHKFQLGNLVATPGSLEALAELNVLPVQLIRRHVSGDWGSIHPEDYGLNEQALIDGGRLMSVYKFKTSEPEGTEEELTIWVITEADRSVTTILLPSEY